MTSSLINYVINNFLSKFIEIDNSQTYASLWSGILELKNLKIKKECLAYVNLPYLSLEIGYISKLKVELTMPFFYSNPIKISISDIFIYAKQKDINNIQEAEEIKLIKDYKAKRLNTEEELFNKIDEIEKSEPSFISQILNNININISNVVLRFDDEISNPVNPFCFSIILKQIKINSANQYYEILNKSTDDGNESVENNNIDFSYKLIEIKGLSMFLDCFDSCEGLKYNVLIDDSIKKSTSMDMKDYLGEYFDFYCYCKSELDYNLNDKIVHDYILYKLDIVMKVSMNSNLENNNPKYELYIDKIENFIFELNLKQISNFFILLSYYNLYYYYQLGLSRTIFKKKIDDIQKNEYVYDYLEHYYQKYKKNKVDVNIDKLRNVEDNLVFEKIKELRKIATDNLDLFFQQKAIEDKINAENNRWFFSANENNIKKYNDEILEIKNKLKNNIKERLEMKFDSEIEETEKDIYSNLPNSFTFYIAKINIQKFEFIIFDNETNLDDNLDEIITKEEKKYKNLLNFHLDNTTISYVGKKYSSTYSITFKNFYLSQNIVKTEDYDKILMSKSNNDKEDTLIEYQTNKDLFGNYITKITFKANVQIYFFFNLYELQYINYNILTYLYSHISFIEISNYTNEKLNKFFQLGYIINEYNRNYKKMQFNKYYTSKMEYDIYLKSPIIIIPQNIIKTEIKKCIIVTTKELILKSKLVKEELSSDRNSLNNKENNINNDTSSKYESCISGTNYTDDLYDRQILSINGIELYMSNNCIKDDDYKDLGNSFLQNFDISIVYKVLIGKNDYKNLYNESCLIIDIKEINFNIDEFQILFLLTYLKEKKYQNELIIKNLLKEQDSDKVMEKYNKEYKEKFLKEMEDNKIILKDEYTIKQNFDIGKFNNKNNNKEVHPEDFYEKPNQFYMEININKIKLIIDKLYPDLSRNNFIVLQFDEMKMEKFTNKTNDAYMQINFKTLSLLDKEQDIKKNYLLPKEFQHLIKNDNDSINSLIYSSLYNNNKNEYTTNIEINEINVLSSFDSLTRIYVFLMYYYGRYCDIHYDAKEKKKMDMNKISARRRTTIYLNEKLIIKEEKIINQNVFKFKIINSVFGIPYDQHDIKKPIFSTRLNLFYDQSSNSENQNIYDLNNKSLLRTKLLYNNNHMNIMICDSYFDIIYLYPLYQEMKKDKIISNYRIQYTNKYVYFLSKQNSISNMNILIEPLIISIDLYQLKYSLNFYYMLMKFIFEGLYSNYVPYLKPEHVTYIDGKPVLLKKRKTLAKIVGYVIDMQQIKKQMYQLNSKKEKEDLINSFSSINLQLDKIYITIFDSNRKRKEKRVLLALELSKIFFNKIYNSKPKDKTNISNELISILTNTPIDIDSYIIRNLYRYMNCTMTLELYYYNLEYSDFEPIIEPINIQYLSYQADEIFRYKTYININNIININVSTSSMKVLNIFLSKYMSEDDENIHQKKDENNIEKEDEIDTSSKPKYTNYLKLLSKESIILEELEETVIKLNNRTGLFIYFWFDFDKENKIKINNKETINLTDKLIYKSRKNKKLIQKRGKDKNTFSFRILNYECIQKINFNKSHKLYFRTKISNENKFLYYNVKIDTSSLIKEITFESSISILNETIFDELLLSIDDQQLEDKELILSKNKIINIPLTWIISSSQIFLQKNKNSEKKLIYNDISQINFSKKESEVQKKEKYKQTQKIKTLLENKLNNFKKINLQHPKYKDYISTFLLQTYNKKNSKKISIKSEKNENILFYLDYCSFINKELEILSENNDNINKTSVDDNIYQFLEYTDKSYEYILLIRPIVNYTNYTPFDITLSNNINNSTISINTMKTIELYDDIWHSKNSLIKIELKYNNVNYQTKLININNNNYINAISLFDDNNQIIRCNITHNLLTKNNILENELEDFSILSYKYIIFFDYIINNRMGFNLYGLDFNNLKKKENNQLEFKAGTISVYSPAKEDLHKLLISLNKDKFDEDIKINVNAINLENNIVLEENKNIYNILCKTTNSINYKYTNILVLQPRYILVNDLDINIYFQQINEKNQPIDEIKKVISKSHIPIVYKKEDKIIFKIGIKTNKNSPWISYSGKFELDNSIEYDLKVEVDESYTFFYPKNHFHMSDKVYLFFRVKNKVTDDGNVYLYITFPDFPIFEIDNRTNEVLKIFESKKEDDPMIINPMTKIPFIWKNNIILTNKFICQILQKKQVLSFSFYNKIKMEIDNNRYINIYNYQKNSLTGTRCITFEEEKNPNKDKIIRKKSTKSVLERLISRKNIRALNRMTIFIKGIGLSFLDEVPKEIFYISFYEIKYIHSNSYTPHVKKNNEKYESYEFYLKNFQIDSSLNNTLKTLIYPKNQNIPSFETEGANDQNYFISALIVKRSNHNIVKEINSVKYPQIDICIQEINVKIDQVIIMNLINLIKGYTSKLDYFQKSNSNTEDILEEENMKTELKIPLEDLKKEKKNANKIFINYLFLSTLRINLTFRLNLSDLDITIFPKVISKIIGSFGSSLVKISDSPIRFNEKIIENIYMEINEITSIFIKSYIKESIFQIYKILGSTDIIGNPINLVERIGTGFFEFVNEPRKGLLEGPSQFGRGLAKGVAGLLNGVVGGTFDSVSKISGTLYGLMQSLTGKNNNDIILDEENEPSNILIGAKKGIIEGFLELYNGFTGLVISPIENAVKTESSNPLNFFKNLGIGLVGFVASPINFVLRIGNSIAVGTKNTFNYLYNKNIKNQRFRFPRYIQENAPLTIYDPDLSAAKEFLFKLFKIENPNILFFSRFICENNGFNGNLLYLLLSQEQIFLFSDSYEIILEIKLSDINSIELKYNRITLEFVIHFKLGTQKVILINKKDNVFACHLYFILDNYLNNRENQINHSKSIQKPIAQKFKLALMNNIENKRIEKVNKKNMNKKQIFYKQLDTIENDNSIYFTEDDEIINNDEV